MLMYTDSSPDDKMQFSSRRSTVHSRRGLVSTSQPLASQAGVKVLDLGGNAVDAAVAVAAALNVTEPSSTGIGGDMFLLYYAASERRVYGLNGSGRSPAALTRDKVHSLRLHNDAGTLPFDSIHSVTTPGAAAGWCDAVEAFGSHTLTLHQILDPAIRLARHGYPVHELTAAQWRQAEEQLQRASPNAHEMLLDGRAPREGEIMYMVGALAKNTGMSHFLTTQPNLARTFEELAHHGKDGFYRGRVADEIVGLVASRGGLLSHSDLAAHRSEFVEPLTYTYAGEYVVHECPPNGQGVTALIALGILESCERLGLLSAPLLSLPHNGTEYLHFLIESLRLAFADSKRYTCDPTFSTHNTSTPTPPFDYTKLLAPDYLDARARLIHPHKVSSVQHGAPEHSSDTVYFTVADEHGNVASFINSNYAGFGTGAVPRGCGFTLQNRGAGFVLDKGHPNELDGGKRPYHTIIPAICTLKSTNDIFLSWSVMGGFNQPQGQLQTFLNILRGLSPQEAVDKERFCIGAIKQARTPNPPVPLKQSALQSQMHDSDINTEVNMEEGVDEVVLEELKRMGHDVTIARKMQRQVCGRGQIIQKTAHNVWSAGSDMRADGCAMPQV